MDDRQIDSYLFNEMPEAEREKFEDGFVGDDALFVEIAERENELVDRYVRDELSASDRERFEKSLDAIPERRQKVANANLLREFIESERTDGKTITIAERSGFFARLADLFSIPAFQFASIAAIVLLGFAAIFLVVENRRLGSLEQELADSRRREGELVSQIENEREAAGDLTNDLNAERERIAKLEDEIARVRGANQSDDRTTVRPTVATLVLSPLTVRGGPTLVKRLELEPGVTRLSIVIDLPPGTGERVSARLNGGKVADNLRVRTRGDAQTISITVPITRIKDERNSIEIIDAAGQTAAEYYFSVTRK